MYTYELRSTSYQNFITGMRPPTPPPRSIVRRDRFLKLVIAYIYTGVTTSSRNFRYEVYAPTRKRKIFTASQKDVYRTGKLRE